MKYVDKLLSEYENTCLYDYHELGEDFPNSFYYDELPQHDVVGVPKASRYVNGRLLQIYSEKENHVGVIAATRLGKTTSFVIPTIVSFARCKTKRSMIVSDPKGEIYRHTAATLKAEGYTVLLLNFRDYHHSEHWNPLTPIYRKYQAAFAIENEVEAVSTPNGPRNKFHGTIFEDQRALDEAIAEERKTAIEEVAYDIDNLALMIAPTERSTDPYWENAARDLFKGFLWAMLEDSRPQTRNEETITEETFSFAQIVSKLPEFMHDPKTDYFFGRGEDSRALQLVKAVLPTDARVTLQCVLSTFSTKMSMFNESAIRFVTSYNSFEMTELTEDKPVILFIDYRDELKVHFKFISLFVQDAYRYLIEHANARPDGKRRVPFYFILDEFGNFPPIIDFETTISACAGRNIFFMLIVQSYAQLEGVYGKATSDIIRDNLNMHVFFGSNNPSTLEEFSRECGQFTRLSPMTALNGKETYIEHYEIETIPRVSKSRLAHFDPGECIVTEANCGYVLLSRLERYYLCKEFKDLPELDEKEYVGRARTEARHDR